MTRYLTTVRHTRSGLNHIPSNSSNPTPYSIPVRTCLQAIGTAVWRVFVVGLGILAVHGQISAQELKQAGPPLPGTQPLTLEGDITSQLVDGVDKFLLREIDQSVAARAAFWKRDLTSAAAYDASLEPNRQRLAHITGVRDPRIPFEGLELVGTTEAPALIAKGANYDVYVVRWPAFGDVTGEGLLLSPHKTPVADIVALPDADQTPEQICGLTEGVPAPAQFARRLAESGCRVVIPAVLSRELKQRAPPGRQGGALLTHREYIYRSAFELGRHLIGYEVQKALAVVDWFAKDAKRGDAQKDPRIGVVGYGEGGLIALYAAALDNRIDAALVSGYFGPRETVWQEPIDRNVFGLLERFGDGELAAMIAPRGLVVEAIAYPVLDLPGQGGAPAKLSRPANSAIEAEFSRVSVKISGVASSAALVVDDPATAKAPFGSEQALGSFLQRLGAGQLAALGTPPTAARSVDIAVRTARQLYELDRHNQALLTESSYVRQAYMSKLDTKTPEAYGQSVEQYRAYFRDEVVGAFNHKPLPPSPRSRKKYETDRWVGYEVVLDVFPDVIAYGVLLMPKDLKEGEKRPVVVCQHGLEGRPTDIFLNDHPAYHDFAAKLCERGFITFAPQNLYIFKDRFRTLQRKGNAIKKTLFSVIVPQHQQIVDWLQTLPNVDPDRIGFYGLSYGGKSAMRIPALVTEYQLSICSADFNEWVAKNASTRLPFSYVWTGEYEIFEFDLGSTFNYAEMAALICPRPFMVERGHTDGVSTDEWVSFEYAKVFHLYSHRLKMADRCEMEVFDGPHTINGKGTYDFLHKHLKWPKTP
ncbi:MAG: dienelactone hydrolase family protein [Pirellulales bacterium]